jgi:hypothetical protein
MQNIRIFLAEKEFYGSLPDVSAIIMAEAYLP